ncbi:MAG: aspartate/methionine/tyrosine aminotransferase, partial [Polyangiales bacterium]
MRGMPRFPNTAPTSVTLSSRVFSGLATKATAMQAAGQVVHALSVGDTYKEPLVVARAESQRVSNRPGLHRYAPPQGENELLEAVSRRLSLLGADVPEKRIQIVSGATSGLSVIASALLMPGDEVLLP